jgi:hypothetical protein
VNPPEERRRAQTPARRETDRLIEYRLELLEKIPEDVARSVGARLDEIRAWIVDEREARRHHDAELDDRIDEIRRDVKSDVADLSKKIDVKFEECGKAIASVGTEQRAGRRAILLALIAAAASIVGTIIGTGGHP